MFSINIEKKNGFFRRQKYYEAAMYSMVPRQQQQGFPFETDQAVT